MRIEKQQTYSKRPQFRGFTELVMGNVFLNKALFDLTSSDIPWVVMANNKEERRERINRSSLSMGMVFVSPLIVLPFVNRFAMKNIVKLTPEFLSKQYNAIRLPNKYLVSDRAAQEGLKELASELKKKNIDLDIEALLKRAGGSYEKLRNKISIAKNIILGTDLMLIAGSFGHIGFFNAWQTKKKTGQNGFSAELKMADKEVIEKRAHKYKKHEKMRYGSFLTILTALVVGLPIVIKRGLCTNNAGKISKFIQKHADKFDYKDAIFMSRLPMALSFLAAHFGIFMSSRNGTERKDNIIRSSSTLSIFFLGDILLASILGRISDKYLKTDLINKNVEKNFLNRTLPPVKKIEELKKTSTPLAVRTSKWIFWSNFFFLSGLMGVLTPYFINKIVRKDVAQDVNKKLK